MAQKDVKQGDGGGKRTEVQLGVVGEAGLGLVDVAPAAEGAVALEAAPEAG